MLRIRLLRMGKKNSPSFRVVVTPRRSAAKTGRVLEVLGFYNPIKHEKALKKERIQYWLSQGAQPSERLNNMLISEGITQGEKIAVHSTRKKKGKEEASEAPKEETPQQPLASQKSPAPPSEEKPAESE